MPPNFKFQISTLKSLVIWAATFAAAGQLIAGDWPQWRGEKRDGHASAWFAAGHISTERNSSLFGKLPSALPFPRQ
jgi:hypothetical protein